MTCPASSLSRRYGLGSAPICRPAYQPDELQTVWLASSSSFARRFIPGASGRCGAWLWPGVGSTMLSCRESGLCRADWKPSRSQFTSMSVESRRRGNDDGSGPMTRWQHDWVQGTGPIGGGCAGLVWALGRPQRSARSGSFALDFSPAPRYTPRWRRAGTRGFASASRCRSGVVSTRSPFYSAGQPALLVLDHSGSYCARHCDYRPDDDHQRYDSPALALVPKVRGSSRPVRASLSASSSEITQIRGIRS
jgi:hypothetical protein